MNLEQSFELALSPAKAWPTFKDLDLLVSCLPGASLMGPIKDGEVPVRFDVKLGPIAAGFTGTGKLNLDESTQSGGFEGSAVDKRTQSRVKGSAQFSLAPSSVGTLVKVAVDYSLTGALAQFGRAGIVKEMANVLTQQFAQNLSAHLKNIEPDVSALSAGLAPTNERKSPTELGHQPLDGAGLLMSVMRTKFQKLIVKPLSDFVTRIFNRRGS